jgi:hypothetical protein
MQDLMQYAVTDQFWPAMFLWLGLVSVLAFMGLQSFLMYRIWFELRQSRHSIKSPAEELLSAKVLLRDAEAAFEAETKKLKREEDSKYKPR